MTSIPASRTNLTLAAGAFALALAASPRNASAACHPPPGETAEPGSRAAQAVEDCRWEHRVGLELMARVGMGMALANNSVFVPNGAAITDGQRLGPGVGIDVALGWRIKPSFSIGGHLYYQYSPGYGLREGVLTTGTGTSERMIEVTGAHSDYVAAGVYGRFYIGSAVGLRRVEPWIGIGFDFPSPIWVTTQVRATRQTLNPLTMMYGPQTVDGSLIATLVSFAVPISVGLDYNVTPEFSLGVSAHVSLLFPYSRCANTSVFSGDPDQAPICTDQTFDVTPTLFVAAGGRFLAPW